MTEDDTPQTNADKLRFMANYDQLRAAFYYDVADELDAQNLALRLQADTARQVLDRVSDAIQSSHELIPIRPAEQHQLISKTVINTILGAIAREFGLPQ